MIVSAATVWEIAIKHALGRDNMPISGDEAPDWFRRAGYDLLPISPAHAVAIEHLLEHRRDPFDRLLVAQAITEPLRLLSRDPLVIRYGDAIIAVCVFTIPRDVQKSPKPSREPPNAIMRDLTPRA